MAILTGTRDIILGYLQEFDLIQHHWRLAMHDSLTLTSVLSHRCQKQQTWRVGEDAQSHICLSLAQTTLEEALQSTCKWSAVGRSGQFYLVKLTSGVHWSPGWCSGLFRLVFFFFFFKPSQYTKFVCRHTDTFTHLLSTSGGLRFPSCSLQRNIFLI